VNGLPTKKLEARPDLIKLKRLTGLIYGIVSGFVFAFAVWGWDGFKLSQSHAYLPWLNLGIAIVLCAILNAPSGWLTARFENSLLGAFFWLISALLFAGLVVYLPLQLNPLIVSKINPQLGEFLYYPLDAQIGFRLGLVAVWVVPFMLIVGVTQLSITESSVYSQSFFGKIIPFFFCIVVLGISGTITDSLINAHFRDAITSLDTTIQFSVDNRDNPQVDEILARRLHVSSLDAVKVYVVQSRRLYVTRYDNAFGQIQILVLYKDQWVDCTVIYSQPAYCKLVE
jgi:hypothetical protein